MSVEKLKKKLAKLGKATTLNIESNYIGDEGVKFIADVIKVNKTINTLNIGENNIGNKGAKLIADIIKVNKTLTTLDIGTNEIGDEGARLIADVIKVNNTITTLNIGANEIGKKGTTLIANALKVNKTITTLDIGGNNIGKDGAKFIADALKINKTITTLDIKYNNIGNEGAEFIANALKENKTLTTLNIRYNNIGKDGAKFIAEALKVNTTLTTLNLWCNRIGDEGAELIANALKVNTTLTTLDIGLNDIGNKGAKSIAEALKVNKTITTLKLVSNYMDSKEKKLITDAIKVNRDLVKKVAELLIKNFDQQKTDQIKIPLKYLKLYQVCDKNLLKKYIGNNKKFDVCTKKADTYISENFTKILGISKSGDLISNKTDEAKSPFAVKELKANIASFLPKILWDIKQKANVKNKKNFKDTLLSNHKLSKFSTIEKIKEAILITKILTNKQDATLLNLASELLSKGNKSITKEVRDYFEIESSGLKKVVLKYLNNHSEISAKALSILSNSTNQFDCGDKLNALGDNELSGVVNEYFDIG